MQFLVRKASDYDCRELVEVSSLEDLKALQERYDIPIPSLFPHGTRLKHPPLVVDFQEMEITIYDAYME